MESKVVISLLALCALSIMTPAQGGLQPGRCPQRSVINPFDLTKVFDDNTMFCKKLSIFMKPPVASFSTLYAGRWYEISMFGAFFEFGGKCAQAVYTPQSDGSIEVVDTLVDITTNKTETVKGTAVREDNSGAGRLLITLPVVDGSGDRTGTYYILDTDYENYALVYSCRDLFIARYDLAWILSRKPTLDEKFREKINSMLIANKLDPKEYSPTPQDCGN